MTDLPPIAIVLITYNRPAEARDTVSALHQNLHYAGQITWYIADDCSPEPYGSDLRHWMQQFLTREITLRKTPQNIGWGANANHCLTDIREHIVLQIEDDYVLHRAIDITPYVLLLAENRSVGLVRLDGIAGHRVVGHATEFNIGEWLPDYRAGYGPTLGRMFYWLLDVASPETWLYSNRPHLKHKRFHQAYGKYPEGLKLGPTEERFAKLVKIGMKEKPESPAIAVPMELALPGFDHIGQSYQHTEFDKGEVR